MNSNLKKLTVSGMLVALATCLSTFSIPIGASRCFPIQHLVNVIAGVFLGPLYGVCIAFSTSFLRNLMGTGSLLAFPGSMIGAFLCAFIYKKTKKLTYTYIGEIIGTGIIGGLVACPIAVLLMGKTAAIFTFVIPFLMSTCCGTIIAAFLIGILYKSKALSYLQEQLEV